MKNREQLPVGAKPAPGNLAFVQGFLNLARFLTLRPDLDRPRVLGDWMVRHGLMSRSARVATADFRRAVQLHDALRLLVDANSGPAPMASASKALNRLADRFALKVVFTPDGRAVLQPKAVGIDRGLGVLMTVVVRAMTDGSWARLKACGEEKCRWVFFDSSKNQSGRWCSMSVCGSRTKARSWRKRQKK